MEISRILKGVELCSTFKDGDVQAVSCDSRTCTRGSLFVAVRGADTDGHSYIGKAIEMGASHIVCEEIPQQVKDADAEFILVKESRKAVAQIASNFYGNPSEKLRVVAVTGTNGKTTSTFIIKEILSSVGKNAGVIGTLGIYYNNKFKVAVAIIKRLVNHTARKSAVANHGYGIGVGTRKPVRLGKSQCG